MSHCELLQYLTASGSNRQVSRGRWEPIRCDFTKSRQCRVETLRQCCRSVRKSTAPAFFKLTKNEYTQVYFCRRELTRDWKPG